MHVDIDQYVKRRGIVSRGELEGMGLTRRQVSRIFAGYRQPRRGLIAHPELPSAAFEAVRLGGKLTCVSAASALGLWVLNRTGVLHLATSNGRKHAPSTYPVIRHRAPRTRQAHPRSSRRSRPASRYTAGIEDICIHAAICLPPLDAAVIIQSAIASRMVSRDVVAQTLQRYGGRVTAVLPLLRERTDSPVEVVLRSILMASGLHFVEQVVLPTGGRRDFIIEDWLIVEADGWEWHGNKDAWLKDMRRDQDAATLGFQTLHFTANQITHQPDLVLRVILQTLRTGGREPGTVHSSPTASPSRGHHFTSPTAD